MFIHRRGFFMNVIAIIEKIIAWGKTSILKKIMLMSLIISVQIFIAFMIFNLGGTKTSFAYFMLLTVILGSFFFGPEGGSFLGLTGGFLLGPFMPEDTLTMHVQTNVSIIFRTFFYIFSGYISGKVTKSLLNLIEELSSITLYNSITQLPNKKYFENMNVKYSPNDYVAVIKFEEYYKMVENFGDDSAIDFINKVSLIFTNTFNNGIEKGDRPNVFHIEDDKFAVIFSEFKIKDAFKNVYKSIYRSIKVKEIEHFPSVFIGVSNSKEDNIKILQNAETARRAAKRSLKSYEIYSPELSEKSNKDFDLLMEIPRALNRREFFLCYHPKIDLRSGKIEGAEVLIRWHHPEKGLIPPNTFIPHIEKTSMINKVTEWVLKTAFLEVKNINKKNIDINISVNIPLKILENPKIIKFLKAHKRNSLPLHKLELEILERDNVDSFNETSSAMKILKKMGIEFSLDDYGTGYSTLSYMQNLPFDKIKIDMMFIKNIETDKNIRELVRSTIEIGHILGMEVVAEGVETKEALEILKNLGCDYAQGYYFTKPLIYKDFIKWCLDYNSSPKLTENSFKKSKSKLELISG
jgi:EAL domain-containing protein (putative c-di-GMP-specific phosphodiesterase class I)/GGDEF domain-containing protein